jgi:uncharacterized protein
MTGPARTLAPGQHAVLGLDYGQTVRIVDDEGGQRAQLVCVNRGDRRERFSAPNTMLLNKGVYFTAGSVLYSYYCQPMMTITAAAAGSDTLPGPLAGGQLEDAAGRAALVAALGEIGLRRAQLPFPLQVFTRHEVAGDGTVGAGQSTSRAGDHIDLRAELDLFFVIVNAGGNGGQSTVTLTVQSSAANTGTGVTP